MVTSRQALASKQRNNNYRPNGQVATHVSQETRYINSTSFIIHSKDGYYVQSAKFAHLKLYYRVTVDEQGNWATSATDERVAQTLIKQVEAYRKERLSTEQQSAVKEAEAIVKQAPVQQEQAATVEDVYSILGVEKPVESPAQHSIHDGYYTVSVEGDKHRTFRLATQPKDASFAPGKQIISFLAGPANEHDYIGFGFVVNGHLKYWNKFLMGYEAIKEAARFLLSGKHADEAGKMYAQESGNCFRCNRLLTDPQSIEVGLGPVCRNK